MKIGLGLGLSPSHLAPPAEGNHAPTDITLSNSEFLETIGAHQAIGTLSYSDVDPGDVITFAMVEGEGDEDNALFEIEGTTLKTADVPFDYEITNTFSIRVRATDSFGNTYDEILPLSCTDVNSPPEITIPSPRSFYRSQQDTIPGISFTDDSSSGQIVTVEANNGASVMMDNTAGITWLTGNYGGFHAILQITGSKAALNESLSGLQYMPGSTISTNTLTITVDDGVNDPVEEQLEITVVNYNPIWNGVPTDPIDLIPSTAVDIDYLGITDDDTVGGGTYVARFEPENGQIKISDIGSLTCTVGTIGSWTGTIELTGSLDDLTNYALPSLQYRPDGYIGDDTVTLTISEDGGVEDVRVIEFVSANVTLVYTANPMNTSVLEGVDTVFNTTAYFSGGSGSDNWTITIRGGDDQFQFDDQGNGQIRLSPRDYEAPADFDLDNTYSVHIGCYDSVTEEDVVTELLVTVNDSQSEVVRVTFDEVPSKGQFRVVTPAGNVVCDAPLVEADLQEAFTTACGAGMVGISNVTSTSFTIAFADSFGNININDITVDNYSTLRYRNSELLSYSPMWASAQQVGSGTVNWTNPANAETSNNDYATTANDSMYSDQQESAILAWAYPTATHSEIEVVSVQANLRGYIPIYVTNAPRIIQWGWDYNNVGFNWVITSIEFPGTIDSFPIFLPIEDDSLLGVTFAQLESAYAEGTSLKFGIVVQLDDYSDSVAVDYAEVTWNYYNVAAFGNAPTIEVLQDGGA